MFQRRLLVRRYFRFRSMVSTPSEVPLTAVGLKKNVAQFCKGRRSEYTRVISSETPSHVMKPTALETLMNCNVLPIKKHLNFY